MPLGPDLLKLIQKKYAPTSVVELRYKRYDLTLKTDEAGDAILLFIGKRGTDGAIKGERYVRTLITGEDGRRIKDHWDLKGRAS